MSDVVRGIDHIGITVRDIEEASRFLVEALGAQVMYDLFAPSQDPARPGTELNGPQGPTGEVVDLTGVTVADAAGIGFVGHRLLRLADGANLELIQLDTADPQTGGYRDIGVSHLALFTDDIEAAAARLEAAGATLFDRSPTMGLEAGEGAQWQYAMAPFGLRIELITYGPMAYEEVTPLRRTWAGRRGDAR